MGIIGIICLAWLAWVSVSHYSTMVERLDELEARDSEADGREEIPENFDPRDYDDCEDEGCYL